MANCNIVTLAPSKACSGKCKGGGGCAPQASVWVLATCAGMAALFRKQLNGHLMPIMQSDSYLSSFDHGLHERLSSAKSRSEFSQLVLVGSANDIAWTHASLPADISNYVAAEIEYPLMPVWFSTAETGKLTQALQHVFAEA